MRHKLATALTLTLAPLATGAAAPSKPYKVTFIQSLAGNPFYNTVSCGAADAAKRLGVPFETQAPQQYQAALQMRVLDAVIAAHPDGIMFAASDPVALTPTLHQAVQQG